MSTANAVVLAVFLCSLAVSSALIDPKTTLRCHLRGYTFRATRTDLQGRQCWDTITTMSCWGRCDSGEISDWRFPFKISFHPICIHEKKIKRATILRNCESGVSDNLRIYEYYEAITCSCQTCDSSTTSCEGLVGMENVKTTSATTYA